MTVSSLLVSLNTVLPFILYMAFGYGVRRKKIASIEDLRKLNRIVFTAFFPLMMFDNIYSMKSADFLRPAFVIFSVGSVAAVLLISAAIVPHIVKDRSRIPVVIQGIYRSNILLFAIPITQNLFGDTPVLMATSLVVLIVPIYNVAAVILLEYYSGKTRSSAIVLLKNILSNPLIRGVLVGLLFRVAGIGVPQTIMKVIHQFSGMTTPLALFILGGTLQFGAMRKNENGLAAVLITKLIAVPAVMLFISGLFGFSPTERFVIFTLFSTPVATAAFPMAQAMGADSELAAELIVMSTTLSVVTLFFWTLGMQSVGMF